jgi:hypothetical protein
MVSIIGVGGTITSRLESVLPNKFSGIKDGGTSEFLLVTMQCIDIDNDQSPLW